MPTKSPNTTKNSVKKTKKKATGEPIQQLAKGTYSNIIFAFIDTETTGLENPHAFNIAYHLAKYNPNTNQLEIFVSKDLFFNPLKPFDPQASAINGYTDDMVKDYPPVSEFSLFADLPLFHHDNPNGVILIGHNIQFDYKALLNTAVGDHKDFLGACNYLCTKILHIDIQLKGLVQSIPNQFNTPNNKLTTIAEQVLGKTPDDLAKAHTASFDAMLCFAYINELLRLGLIQIENIIVKQSPAELKNNDYNSYQLYKTHILSKKSF